MKNYNSLEELMSSRGTDSLKCLVSSVLRNNKHMSWNFVSASIDGNVSRAEFIAQSESPGLTSCLSYVLEGGDVHGHISSCA